MKHDDDNSDRGNGGDADDTKDYPIGYKKPPKSTRFKPGQSGNPKGRSKGSKNLSTLLDQELSKQVVVHENGVAKTRTKRQVVAAQVANKAAKGDHKSIQLINQIEQANLQAESNNPSTPPTYQLQQADHLVMQSILERIRRPQLPSLPRRPVKRKD